MKKASLTDFDDFYLFLKAILELSEIPPKKGRLTVREKNARKERPKAARLITKRVVRKRQ